MPVNPLHSLSDSIGMKTMNLKFVLLGAVAIVVLGLAGLAGWILTLPAAPAAAASPPLAEGEAEAMLAALKPPKRERPVIAIIGINDATETTDYLMPYGILRRADVADVSLVATAAGPVTLFPALTVEPDTTVERFDRAHPEGADYVLVPAMSRDDDPAALEWIRTQASKGATIVGICAGAKVVGALGLLDGKRSTTHWFYLDEMLQESPAAIYVADRRIVVDAGIATTTGVSASMPFSLTLIEAIAGRARAEEVAAELGLTDWDARHASSAFRFSRPFATTVLKNVMSFWNRDQIAIELAPGLDEVWLALVADAWSRTYRSQALTYSRDGSPVTTENGLRVVPDEVARPDGPDIDDFRNHPPAQALEETLQAIEERYGRPTADVVAMQLEYPR